jgi:hypothetical protein
MNKRQEIARLVTALGEYYDKPLTPTQIATYSEDLMELEPAQLAQAIKAYRNDPRNDRFPLPAKLKAAVGMTVNPEDEAVRVAGKILGAIAHIGPYDSAKAREYIGEAGWQVVQWEGGWESICEIQTDDIPIRKAQWRNMAKSVIERPEQRIDRVALTDQSAKMPSLESFNPQKLLRGMP